MNSNEGAICWSDVQIGSEIVFKQKIGDDIKRIVSQIIVVSHFHELCDWIILELGDHPVVTDQHRTDRIAAGYPFLVIKIYDQTVKLRGYLDNVNFAWTSRQDVIDRNDSWLFQKSRNHDAELSSLKYADFIEWDFGDDVSNNGYAIKDNEIRGHVSYVPKRSGDYSATLVEYRATRANVDYSDLLILEIENVDDPNGGSIVGFLGNLIDPLDIQVTNLGMGHAK